MNTPGKSTTWLTSVAIALLVVLPTAAPLLAASAASKDLQLLQGLRDRRQYEQAEKYCAEQLRDARLSDARRLELTLELSRTLAQHAVDSPAAEQGALWKRSRDVLVEFEAANARHPRLVLLRVQSGLTAVAQGESARENAELAGDAGKRTDEARALLRGAITQLRKLDESLGAEIQLRGRTPRVAEPDQLSTAELNSLRSHVRYQLARALRNQSLCFAAGSADRTNALMQAVELLSELARQDFESPLAWSSRVD